uniref:Isoform 2 of LIM and SH3 domain protein 1 n=1 Tax=Homo sapiens TaxID=9606 RepID=Q14847-2
MNPNCARCGKIVYPTEKVNCLDKFWHKACFHCETCKMTLNMKNYKGYEKKPYCNAHYPKQSFTMVADTPENLRLKQQSELQSQVRYKEEFEKNKGKGFSVVADTPELQRIKKTQDQISNIKYHEEFEKSRMGPSGGEGMEPERRDSQDGSSYRRPLEQQQPHHIPTSAPVYQQPQQQPVAQSYGGYKEPAAPVSIQRSAPICLQHIPRHRIRPGRDPSILQCLCFLKPATACDSYPSSSFFCQLKPSSATSAGSLLWQASPLIDFLVFSLDGTGMGLSGGGRGPWGRAGMGDLLACGPHLPLCSLPSHPPAQLLTYPHIPGLG